ncbi:MAG TPA: tRNA (N(6)-L-threonylcarbamoyladenosine(37)-C(2))-methylthiotransferase MtaB [Bellilinea sp.]|nr:tRNA (N(6)-L-threonylcarbamoyladenosine(37)-C(2))-methylthiotransferase MtaB [Bellilinea sp.]
MKIFLDSIGCRLNQSEIESYARKFLEAGHELTHNAVEADIAVINTCAVTSDAAADSRQRIRKVAKAGGAALVLTGCLSSLDPVALASFPQVIDIVPNEVKDDLVERVLEKQVAPKNKTVWFDTGRYRTRAFIKVQDGCDNRCTYCVTRVARGRGRSVPTQSVLEDVQAAIGTGVKEIVLTGVHLASWGKDFSPRKKLKDLVRYILDESPVDRLRLSSVEPWDLDDSFFDLWQARGLCRHLHLPLQSGSNRILRRMARNTTTEKYRKLVESARAKIPELAVTTDVIVGFPGETDADFEESLIFVRGMQFSGGHVFMFSPREGTAAADFPDKVASAAMKERSRLMQQLLADSETQYKSQFVGTKQQVLWEHSRKQVAEKWLLPGLTDNYLRITAHSQENRWNQFDFVLLQDLTTDGLHGEIINEH